MKALRQTPQRNKTETKDSFARRTSANGSEEIIDRYVQGRRRKEEKHTQVFQSKAGEWNYVSHGMQEGVDILRIETMDDRYSQEGTLVAVLSAVTWSTPMPRFAHFGDKE